MKNILMGLIIFCSLTIQSQPTKKNARYVIDVNGNCEQCKKRIEKAAYAVPGVKMAVWDVDSKKLNLIINEEKTSLTDVKKAVAKVGHDTDDIKSTDDNYNSLHHCCLYERKK